MLRLQCLVNSEENVRVVSLNVSLSERIDKVELRLAEKMKLGAEPNKVVKLYSLQHQRLTYRLDIATKLEVLFLDGAVISGAEARSSAVLQNATQLVPWALVAWYFHEQQFTFPDAVDVIVVWDLKLI